MRGMDTKYYIDKNSNICLINKCLLDGIIHIYVREDMGFAHILKNLFKSLSSNKSKYKEWFKQMAEAIISRRGMSIDSIGNCIIDTFTQNTTYTMPNHKGNVYVILFGGGGGWYGGHGGNYGGGGAGYNYHLDSNWRGGL